MVAERPVSARQAAPIGYGKFIFRSWTAVVTFFHQGKDDAFQEREKMTPFR
jgi:hypothetical protein